MKNRTKVTKMFADSLTTSVYCGGSLHFSYMVSLPALSAATSPNHNMPRMKFAWVKSCAKTLQQYVSQVKQCVSVNKHSTQNTMWWKYFRCSRIVLSALGLLLPDCYLLRKCDFCCDMFSLPCNCRNVWKKKNTKKRVWSHNSLNIKCNQNGRGVFWNKQTKSHTFVMCRRTTKSFFFLTMWTAYLVS